MFYIIDDLFERDANKEWFKLILICQYVSLFPFIQIYTKSFTLALQTECKPYGIKVQLLSPYFVSTKLNNYSKHIMSGNLFVPDVQTYGRWAAFTLAKTYETTGYWSHAVQVRNDANLFKKNCRFCKRERNDTGIILIPSD